jgi:hypothetical protein
MIERRDFDLDFFCESVSYVFYTNDQQEAFYLTTILNSSVANLLIKDFQAKGLFGARHVHKKILGVYFPKFDESNPKHIQLAQSGNQAHEKVKLFLAGIPPIQKVEGTHLGRIRLEIKKHLVKEMKEIDEIVRGIVALPLSEVNSLNYEYHV